MLDVATIQGVAAEVADLVREKKIPFLRGEPRAYFGRIAKLASGLTLSIVPPERARDTILLKALYTLWNIVVDDEIDRAGTTRELDASTVFLLTGSSSTAASDARASSILERMKQILPGGSLDRSRPLGFDLWEIIHAFTYEHFTNKSPERATELEYQRYSTMSASLKVFLDIDLVSNAPLPAADYRGLRLAYDDLSCAIKLSSDIGTVRREIQQEDSMNLLRILAEGRKARRESAGSEEDALTGALRFRDEVAAKARAHLTAAEERFEALPDVGAQRVLGVVRRVVEVYTAGEDPFFD